MFVLRCLNTLLLGYTALVRGAPSQTSSDTTIQLARSLPYDWNDSDSEPLVEDNHAGSNIPTAVPVTPVRLYDGRESVQAAMERKGTQRLPREAQNLSPPEQPLEDKNGNTSSCANCLPNVSGASTVFLTKPITRTVTAVIGPPVTSLIISTETDTLTFLNPGLRIQTSIITVTSFFNPERRTAVLAAESSAVGDPYPGESLNGRDDLVTTSTIEEVSVATKTTQSTVFATRTNTVFQTVTVAESATSTVFSTTTVFTTSPKSETSVAVSQTATETEPLTTVSGLESSSVTGLTSVSIIGSSSRATTIGLPPSSTSLVSSETTIRSSSSLPSSLSVSITTSESATSLTTAVSTIQSARSTGGIPFPPATPAPTATLVPGSSLPGPGLNSSQIAGIVLGGVSGLFLISLALFALRWCIRRRRSRLAELRQQISDPSMAAGATAAGARGLGSPNGSARSALTGEGEVRIVIRPARSQTWPMPPGHAGQTYSLFIEETTTGETSPAADPATWSNASDSGSVMNIPRKPILSASGPGTTESRSRGSSSGPRSTFTGGRSVPGTAGTGAAAGGTTTYRGPTEQSLVSVGWGTSVGGRSDFSGAGVNTNLSPPPAALSNDRTGSRGGARRWEDPGSWGYPGSWGIGKAL